MSDIPDFNRLFALDSALPPPKTNPALAASSLEFLAQIHRRKSEALKAMLLEHGWYEVTHASENGTAAAFIIIHHADYDPEFQRHCHGIMLIAARAGKFPLGLLAFLTDRILIGSGMHQRFGTQLREVQNGCFVPKPLEDPDHIDELREQVGLVETLADYLQRINDGDELLYRPLLSNYAEKLEYLRENKVIPFPTAKH